MTSILSAAERDKAVISLRDIKGLLEHTKDKPTYEDLTDVQNALESRGLRITAIPKPESFTLTPATAPALPPVGPVFSPQQVHKVETFVQAYRSFKRDNKTGYVFKNEAVGSLLEVICPVANIPFTK